MTQLPLLLATGLCLGISACDSATDPSPAPTTPAATTPEPAEAGAAAPPAAGAERTPGIEAAELIQASPFAAQATLLEGALAPHLRLAPTRSSMDELRPGQSRLAGLPDLPAGVAWPTAGDEPMALLAQIDLSNLDQEATAGLLPERGWLYLFLAVDSFGQGDEDAFAVLFHEGPAEKLVRTEAPAGLPQAARAFEPCAVSLLPGVSLPSWKDARYPQELDLQQQLEAWYELSIRVMGQEPPGEPIHHLLGHPQLIDGDPRAKAAAARGGAPQDWNLLLQLASDELGPGWIWGELGSLYLLIRDEDRAAGRFDQAWLVKQER
jgi:uncharacterized protein YwqG